ncbi:MAG: adenylyltransferase/cytidyltransferase family protein, partial [bacterium]
MVDRVADLKIKQVVEYFIGKVESKPYSGKLSQAQYYNPKFKESVLSVGTPNIPSNLLSFMYFGKVVKSQELALLGQALRKQGKKVVFTAMGGDLLHVGHAKFLKKAAELGNVLVVGTPSNQSMRRQKGAGRPIIDEQSRAELLCYLKGVDYVVIFGENTVLATLKTLKPDIFQTVDDVWNKNYKNSPEYRAVTKYGGKVVLCPKQAEGVSATQLINKAAKIRLEKMFHDCLGIN